MRLLAALPLLLILSGCRNPKPLRIDAAPALSEAPAQAPSDGWRAIARLPRPLATKAIVALDGVLYFFSGAYAEGPTNDVTAYDLSSRRWTVRAPMPQSHYNQDAVALGGKIYMAGGCVRSDCSLPSGAAYSYDPKEDFWTVLPALPEGIFDGSSAAIDGRFVVIGGVANRETSRRVYAYNPGRRTWARLADLPSPRSHAGGAMFGGLYYLTGGCKGGQPGRYCDQIAEDVFIYDPKKNAWSSGPPLPTAIHGHGAAVDGGRLIIAGGVCGPSRVADCGAFMLKSRGHGWAPISDILRTRFGARLFALPRGVGLFGPNYRNNADDLVEALGYPGPYVDPGQPSIPVPAPPSRIQAPVSDPEHPRNLPLAAAPNARAHAVVIGVERYRENLPRADFAASDAKLAAEYFRRVLGVSEENLALLRDERATKSDFEKYFERWLPNRVESGDEVFVYFSGHGAPNPRSGESYLVPYDADPTYIEQTGYPLSRVYELLSKLPAKRVLLVLDSCFSGGGGRSVLAKGARPLVSVVPSKVPSGLTVISASAGDQISNSYRDKQQGLFTYYFLKGLKEKGGDLRAVFDYLKPRVSRVARREYNSDQVPQWSKGK